MDLGGARLGGLIKLGLSEYVFCDHFGFVYVFPLEECDRVVAARTIGSAPPAVTSHRYLEIQPLIIYSCAFAFLFLPSCPCVLSLDTNERPLSEVGADATARTRGVQERLLVHH